MSRRLQAGLILVLFALFTCTPALAQQLTKRLILKDGNYQPATRWEIKGDRVRYYSAERSEWEELPTSMVDWAATEKYNNDLATGAASVIGHPRSESSAAASAEDAAEAKIEQSKSPMVVPGLKLPDSGGVYLLDFYQQKPELVEVTQSGGELNKNMTRNILIATIDPIASSKQSIEIKGPRAQVQAHQAQPALYVQVSQSADDYANAGNRQNDQTKPPPELAQR